MNQHIVPHADGWAVKSAGAGRATKVHKTQSAAAKHGRQIAKNNHSELFIHGRNGRIRERNTYGQDNFPPRG